MTGSHNRDVALRIGRNNIEPGCAAVVQRDGGSHHRPARGLACRLDDVIIRHDQPTSVEDDARAHNVIVDVTDLQCHDTGQDLRGDPLDPVGREVSRGPRTRSAGGERRFVDSDRMNQQNHGQSGYRGRDRHSDIPQHLESNPYRLLSVGSHRDRPVRRGPSGGCAAWLCSDGMPATVTSSRDVHHSTVMPRCGLGWQSVLTSVSPQFVVYCVCASLARTSKSERINKIGCYLECRESPMSVVTGNANRVTRLAGIGKALHL